MTNDLSSGEYKPTISESPDWTRRTSQVGSCAVRLSSRSCRMPQRIAFFLKSGDRSDNHPTSFSSQTKAPLSRAGLASSSIRHPQTIRIAVPGDRRLLYCEIGSCALATTCHLPPCFWKTCRLRCDSVTSLPSFMPLVVPRCVMTTTSGLSISNLYSSGV